MLISWLRCIGWHKILYLEKAINFNQLSFFLLGIATLLVGLKIRLIGQSALSDNVDANFLILGCIFLLFAIFSWKGAEISLTLLCPMDLRSSPNREDYLERMRKRAATPEDFSAGYTAHCDDWQNIDVNEKWKPKIFILTLFLLAGALSVMSLASFVVALGPMLPDLIDRIQASD